MTSASNQPKIRTRFPPSPTGDLHLGGARTALFNWLFARHHGGEFVIRIEDTDLERSTAASTQAIFDAMHWLGLNYDNEPCYQTQKFERYQAVIGELLNKGHAYHCYTTPEELATLREQQMTANLKPRYDRRWRDSHAAPPKNIAPVVRFKMPLTGSMVFNDGVYGPIEIANEELDDLIIARSDGTPTYNLCVVVDDIDMGISHIIRGDDHLNNTPKQIHIYEALGASVPEMTHVPMVLGDDGARLSKRHGAVGVMQYQKQGYLPEAMLNYLVRLGWSHGDQEVFSLEQMVQHFSLEGLNKSPARFDAQKLNWMNAQYLKSAQDLTLVEPLKQHLKALDIEPTPDANLTPIVHLLKERHDTLSDMADNARYFFHAPENAQQELELNHNIQTVLDDLSQALESLDDWQAKNIFDLIKSTAKQHQLKVGQVGMPLRILLCGQSNTPSIGHIAEILGKQVVLDRLAKRHCE